MSEYGTTPRFPRLETGYGGGTGGRRLALFVFSALALLRIAYAIEAISETPVLDEPLADSIAYRELAQEIGSGHLLLDEPFYRAPLYPYLLAPAYAVSARPEVGIALAQVLLGIGSLFIVWRIAHRLYGSLGGLIALLAFGLFGAEVAQETKILPTVLGTFLGLAALSLLIRARSALGWMLGGVVLGAAVLVRPGLLLLAPFPPILVHRTSCRVRVRLPAYLAGILLAILPATLHNLHAGEFVPISSNGGITFYHGNNLANDSGLPEPGPLLGEGINAVRQAEVDRTVASRWSGRPLGRSESSAFWFRAGIEDLRSDPARAARLFGKKLLRFVSLHGIADIYSPAVEKRQVVLLRFFPIPFALLLALAMAGLLLRPPRADEARLVVLFALSGLVVSLLFHAGARYRMESAPACSILAGSLLATGTAISRRGAVRAAVGFVAVLALSLLPAGPIAQSREAVAAAQWAGALERTGRDGEAKRMNRVAVQWDPSLTIAWGRLALLEGRDGGPEAEVAVCDEGIAAGGDGPLLRRQRGLAQFDLDRFAQAAQDFRAALELEPEDASTRLSLGICLARLGLDAEADALLRSGPLAANPAALRHRGLLAARAGRWKEAAAALDAAGGTDLPSTLLRAKISIGLGEPQIARARIGDWGGSAGLEIPPETLERLIGLLGLDPATEWPEEGDLAHRFPAPLARALVSLESLWIPAEER